jgi:hypothetical protein
MIEIVDEIERLAVHCRPPLMQVEQRESWLRDWCDDLAGFEIEAIRSACREWRQSGAQKFPTPGQLLPMVRKRTAGPRADGGALQPWRELSDGEYEALSLRDKIRHQRILAAEAYRKAGPMWRNGAGGANPAKPVKGHVAPDQMPDTWRYWTDIARSHDAEAQRLASYLHRQPMAAE